MIINSNQTIIISNKSKYEIVFGFIALIDFI